MVPEQAYRVKLLATYAAKVADIRSMLAQSQTLANTQARRTLLQSAREHAKVARNILDSIDYFEYQEKGF